MNDVPALARQIEAAARTYLAAEPDLSAARLCALVADAAHCRRSYAALVLDQLKLLPRPPLPMPRED